MVDRAVGMRGEVLAPPPTSQRARKAWLAARKVGLGASEVAAVLNLSPWRTPLEVWLDKTDPAVRDDDRRTEQMAWGQRQERPIVDEFRVRHAKGLGVRVMPSPGLLRHEEHSWLLATPDRILASKPNLIAVGPLEAKTAFYGERRVWLEEGVPRQYGIQVQTQLAVTGLARAWLVVVFGGNHMPEPTVVERDETAIAMIVELTQAWWERHVLGGEMPAPSIADAGLLAQVWPEGAGAVELSPELAARVRVRARMERRVNQLKEAMARVDLDVRLAMRDAYRAEFHGESLATWSRFERRQVDLDAMRREHPDLVAKFTTKVPSQRFAVGAAEREETTHE